jgi:hypothetical protein
MTMERSHDMYRAYRDAQEKFDMYVLGAVLAICAYLGQSMPYAKIGFNPESVFLVSLILFVGSAYCGFKRMEHSIVHYRLNHQYLDGLEKQDHIYASEVRGALENNAARVGSYYRFRNSLMFLGLVAYVAGKYWLVYAKP